MAKRLVVNRRTFTLRSREEESEMDFLDRNARSHVVLVEDDAEMRRMLAWALRRDGHQVLEAASGAEALEILGSLILDAPKDGRPMLVVSDVRLPHFSGVEILEAVRLTTRRIPVILMTAFADEALHGVARDLGAACVLDKPFDVETLRCAVRSALPSS